MGWTEYQQVRYATAHSVFKWDGTDTVKVGSDETPVRVLDEVSTNQARWHNRYWIDSEGQIRQSERCLGADYFPVKKPPSSRRQNNDQTNFCRVAFECGSVIGLRGRNRQGVQQWQQ